MNAPVTQLDSTQNLGDRELLRRFALDSDEAAFAEIVRRYERLVMSVCRRVIGSGPDADDAFQATFVTLARKPKQIRKIESLSSWLYSVAWRISARLVRARRKNPVQPLPEEHSALDEDPLQKIAAHQHATILDQELQTLPNKYRDVLVMTYFAEQTSQQIADQLDVSKGTVDGRIRQARNMLRVKLARRGVGIGALVAAASLLKAETAAASPTLVSSTIELGIQTLSQSVPETVDTSHIEPLVRPEIASMIGTKSVLSTLVGVIALAGVAGMSGGHQNNGTDATSVTAAAADTRQDKDQAEASAESTATAATPTPAAPVAVTMTAASAESTSVSANTTVATTRTLFSAYPSDVRPTEKWLFETMDKSVPAISHKAGTRLPEVLSELAEFYSKNDDGQTMRIWPDRLALEELQIESLDDVVLARDIELADVTLRSALKLILQSLATVDEPLTLMVKNEVLMVTTQAEAEAEENYYIVTYNVESLLDLDVGMGAIPAQAPGGGRGGGGLFAVPSQLGGGGMGGGGGGSSADEFEPSLTSVVMSMTRPPALWQDTDGEGGTIAVVGKKLVVRQNAGVHREIARLLNLLSENK